MSALRTTLGGWKLLAAAAAVAAVTWVGFARSRDGSQAATVARNAPRAVPVVAAPARTADIAVHLDGIGTVTPLATVTVRPRVDGELMSVRFREGDTVHAGDLLAEIDPRPFQVQLTQAEGQMARDQALLANAKIDLARYQVLLKQDSVARQQLDTQAALVRQYEGAILTDQGQIDNAQLQLTYSRITAPVSGRVGLRLVDPGNIVHASDAGGLVLITQMQPITVLFTIPEDSLPPVLARLRAGEQLPVQALDREKARLLAAGTLLTVDNVVDPSTGTVRLKAEFPNDDEALFPNQFVNARLQVEVRAGATVVPDAAIQRGAQGTFVYVVKDDRTVDARPVRIGIVDGDAASIDEGLSAGELVVVDGAEGLRPGSPVTLQAHRGADGEAGRS